MILMFLFFFFSPFFDLGVWPSTKSTLKKLDNSLQHWVLELFLQAANRKYLSTPGAHSTLYYFFSELAEPFENDLNLSPETKD